MPTNQEIMGTNPSAGSIVVPVDLSTCPQHTKVILKAIIYDIQFSGAEDVQTIYCAPKCYVVFFGAGLHKTPRPRLKTRRIED